MIDAKDIVLSDAEINRCIDFSTQSAATQQAVEFGQHTTKERSTKEISRDTLIGKIAETAFSKLLKENYGIDVPLDFNCYPRGRWDDQDAVINGWRIDVKGTRQGGHWLLIEWNKLNFRQKDDNLSHVFVMFSVGWDRSSDTPTGHVRYEGAVSLERLNNTTSTTKTLRKGDVLPGTRMALQADNYAVHFNDLHKDLDEFTKYLSENTPPNSLTEDYRNPYSGKTTAQIRREKAAVIVPHNACDEVRHDEDAHFSFFAALKSFLARFFS